MVKSKEQNIGAIRIAVIASALLLGFGGGRLIKGDAMVAQAAGAHSMPTAYTQSDGDTVTEYSELTVVASVDDL